MEGKNWTYVPGFWSEKGEMEISLTAIADVDVDVDETFVNSAVEQFAVTSSNRLSCKICR